MYVINYAILKTIATSLKLRGFILKSKQLQHNFGLQLDFRFKKYIKWHITHICEFLSPFTDYPYITSLENYILMHSEIDSVKQAFFLS